MKWVLISVTLVLGLAACGGGDDGAEPRTTSSATVATSDIPTASSSRTPAGPVKPTLPAAAKHATKAGAEAFVRYYFAEVSYALITGKLAGLIRLNGPTCAGCDGGAAFIKRIYSKGGSVSAGPYRVSHVAFRSVDTTTKTPVYNGIVTTESTRQVIRMPHESVQRIPPTEERYGVTTIFTQGTWRVDVLGKIR